MKRIQTARHNLSFRFSGTKQRKDLTVQSRARAQWGTTRSVTKPCDHVHVPLSLSAPRCILNAAEAAHVVECD